MDTLSSSPPKGAQRPVLNSIACFFRLVNICRAFARPSAPCARHSRGLCFGKVDFFRIVYRARGRAPHGARRGQPAAERGAKRRTQFFAHPAPPQRGGNHARNRPAGTQDTPPAARVCGGLRRSFKARRGARPAPAKAKAAQALASTAAPRYAPRTAGSGTTARNGRTCRRAPRGEPGRRFRRLGGPQPPAREYPARLFQNGAGRDAPPIKRAGFQPSPFRRGDSTRATAAPPSEETSPRPLLLKPPARAPPSGRARRRPRAANAPLARRGQACRRGDLST